MHPTDQLSLDHRFIERALVALEAGARQLAAGAAIAPAFFLDAARFITDFTDGAHHQKEERHLFPALEAAGFPRSGGPVAVMLHEHEEGRRHTRGLRSAAERLAAGESAAALAVVEHALGYVALLRQHIQKEDQVLFMMAKRALAPEVGAVLTEAFAAIDAREGARERWVEVVEALERDLAAQPVSPG